MPAPGPQPSNSESEPQLDPARLPRIIAHRGLSGLYPENTLRSFREALAVGARMLELDVTRSRDGALVVIHDADLDRTTNGTGPVCEHSMAELRSYDAGSWFAEEFAGERIPTLAEVLELARPDILVNVEIKQEAVGPESRGGVVEAVIEAIHDVGMARRVLLSSFEPRALVQAREIEKSIPRASLFNDELHRGRRPSEILQEVGASCFNLGRDQVTEKIVEECHDRNARVLVYTVNDPLEMEALYRLGVDGIFTDRADVGLEVVAGLAGEGL